MLMLMSSLGSLILRNPEEGGTLNRDPNLENYPQGLEFRELGGLGV